MTHDCLLALGSNMGRRRAHLRRALGRLARLPGGKILARSRFFETAAVGPRQRRYINLAVRYRTALSPMGLLVELKRLEALGGRKPGRRWGPRPLDIDIIDYGGRRLRGPWLTLPHPRAVQRAFVLAPLQDIAPQWRPAGRATTARLLARLNPAAGTVGVARGGAD
ncbi:MAG TPA: 2-amino-4-hydroxy-6-hydroxymethyldihydropteridine diphosphokinase [Elusimicrobia bacterium]|nr:2-amino-4-hydroxy-6-hydroxymethyldihydropteridine diphosphokinase [Elusimicrobiota bacterium]HBT60533.1 2-amino-4-hydroxy-6-hydroxymethyldihydropteridine diphosphokinase [Elusimicrobiota bacterium]